MSFFDSQHINVVKSTDDHFHVSAKTISNLVKASLIFKALSPLKTVQNFGILMRLFAYSMFYPQH